MEANEADARTHVEGGSKRWAVVLGVLGVVAAAVPVAVGTDSLGMLLGLFVGAAFGAAALAAASDATPDGPPPRRSA